MALKIIRKAREKREGEATASPKIIVLTAGAVKTIYTFQNGKCVKKEVVPAFA